MERKHGFNCNIMHENRFLTTQKHKSRKEKLRWAFRAAFSSAFGKFIAFVMKCRKVERKSFFNFQHQSLNGINLSPPSSTLRPPSLFNEHTNHGECVGPDEVHFHYLFFTRPQTWIELECKAKRKKDWKECNEKLCITTRWKLLFFFCWLQRRKEKAKMNHSRVCSHNALLLSV